MRVTVVIVDDHAGFRRMARRMLEEAGFEVVGEAGDGYSALSVISEARPRLVLLDAQLPDTDGFAVASRLAEMDLGVAVVLTSSRSASDYGTRLSSVGARAFIPKAELSPSALGAAVGP